MSITTTNNFYRCFLVLGKSVPCLGMSIKMDISVKNITPCPLKRDVGLFVSMVKPVRIMH
jgi:hypothetical protein